MPKYTFGRHNSPLFTHPLYGKEPFPWLADYIREVSQGEDSLESIESYYKIFKNGFPYRNWWVAEVETEFYLGLIVFDPWEQRVHQEATNRLEDYAAVPKHLVFEAHF